MIMARAKLSAIEAGLYGVVFALRNLVFPFAFAVSLPLYSRSVSKTELPYMFRKALMVIFFISLAYFLMAIFFPKTFINLLFGAEFILASMYLKFYGIYLFFHIVSMVIMLRYAATERLSYPLLLLPIIVVSFILLIEDMTIFKIIAIQTLAWIIYLISLAIFGSFLSFFRKTTAN